MQADSSSAPPAAASLIRDVEGVETPRPGTWALGAGQPVVIHDAPRWRRRERDGRIVAGTLVIGEDITASTLSLVIARSEPGRDLRIEFHGRLVRADATGRWHSSGRIQIGTSSASSTVDALYRGVYRSGAHPVAWLTMHGHTHVRRGQIGARPLRLDWTADVNADPPVGIARC